MNFCSNCGSDTLAFTVPEGDNRERFVCSNCSTIFYDNPRIIVGCLVSNEKGEILLAKRAIEPCAGLWNLPAGFLENAETAEEGALRETLEETEATVSITGLHCVYSLPNTNQVYLHFKAKIKNPHIAATAESTEVKWFAKGEIPWSEIAFSSTAFAIEKHLENPSYEGIHIGSYR